jgi:DNA-binding protein HU-beta
MNRAELVDEISKLTGQTKVDARNSVTALLHVLTSAIAKGERITLVGFGTFERRERSARTGVNPQNPKQKMRIAAAKVPAFRAGQELKDIVDGRAKLQAMPKAAAPVASKPKKAAKPVAAKKKAVKGKSSKKKGRR